MPDWIGNQMAGVRPEATRVFGRNAQTAVIERRANVSNRHLASVSTGTQKSASSSPSCCWQPASPRFQSTCDYESHSFRLYRGATVTGADIDIARDHRSAGVSRIE
jgi:hypothetical protein